MTRDGTDALNRAIYLQMDRTARPASPTTADP